MAKVVGFRQRRTKRAPRVSTEAVARMRLRPVRPADEPKPADVRNPFEACVPFTGVLPKGRDAKGMAMDAGFDASVPWDMYGADGLFAEGYVFPGFQVLAQWTQISEYRRPSEIYAREMTREWIEFTSKSEDEDKSDRIAELEKEFERLDVKGKIRKLVELDGQFGRGQLFLDLGDEKDPAELKTELVIDPKKVKKGSLVRLTTVEPMWSYPSVYNANDPLDPTYYRPVSWYVMGKEVHSTRLLTYVSRPLPDVLKPSYAFSGMSLSQLMKPYVDNWLRTRQSVSDLVSAFTVWTLKTDMSQILNNGGAEDFFNRLQVFNLGRDNHGVNAIDKETEDFDNVSANIAGLDKLNAQSQEQMCAPCGIPLVYMTGITPAGLNASSDGEIRVFQDTTSANQELLTTIINTVMHVAMISLWGEVDEAIGMKWNPLYSLSEAELAAARKTEAETDQIYLDTNVISAEEVRRRIATQEDTPYQGLDVDELPEPPEEPEPESNESEEDE